MILEFNNVTNEDFEAIKKIIKTDDNGKITQSTKTTKVKVFFTEERRIMKELHELKSKSGFLVV